MQLRKYSTMHTFIREHLKCLSQLRILPNGEIHDVIRFLGAKGVKAAKIHFDPSEIYEENFMSNGMLRKWVRTFIDGCTNVHDV